MAVMIGCPWNWTDEVLTASRIDILFMSFILAGMGDKSEALTVTAVGASLFCVKLTT
jgi:hypothetical protein